MMLTDALRSQQPEIHIEVGTSFYLSKCALRKSCLVCCETAIRMYKSSPLQTN